MQIYYDKKNIKKAMKPCKDKKEVDRNIKKENNLRNN